MAWDKTIPDNDELLVNFPALCRSNWEALEALTNASLQITNAKVAAAAGIVDTKLAQITTASKVHGTSITGLASVPAGAGVLPVANSPAKLKADAADSTPQYLDNLIDTAIFQISAGDLLQLKNGGVATDKLVGGAAAPGNSKYYGTNSGGTKGFYSLPTDPGTVKPDAGGSADYLDGLVDGTSIEITAGDKLAVKNTLITLYDYGASLTAYSQKNIGDIKFCFGHYTVNGSAIVDNLPYTSIDSYEVFLTVKTGGSGGYSSECRYTKIDASSFYLKEGVTGTQILSWMTIGT
jgi:hypothetical protein